MTFPIFRTIFSFCVCISFILCTARTVESAEQPTPTVEDIINGIRQMDKILFLDSNAFLVVAVRTKCENITPSQYSGGYLNTRFALGRKGNDWYALKQFLKIDSVDNILILPNGQKIYVPPEPKITVVKETQLVGWEQPGKPTITIQHFNMPGFEGRNIFESVDYFRHLGLNAGRHIAEAEGVSFDMLCQIESKKDYLEHPFLPDYLEKNKERYTIGSKQEQVDGFPCWVVEYPGMDKLWIDTKYNCIVRKRIYHWEPGKPKKFTIHNSDFREVKPGLYLPYQQTVDKYASIKSEDKKIWDKIACRLSYQLETIAFDNDVPDDIFIVRPELGTHVIDEIRGIDYTVSDPNADPFAGQIAQGIRVRSNFAMFRALFIIAGSVLIVLALYLKMRQLERRDKQNRDNNSNEK